MLLVALSREVAFAHGYGERYTLPVPLLLFLLGAGVIVVGAFAALAFRRSEPESPSAEHVRGVSAISRPLRLAVETVSVALFLLVIAAGLFGSSNPLRNIAPQLVLVAWWLGVAYLSAFIGNIWPLLDPWRILFDRLEPLTRSGQGATSHSPRLPYPRWLGVWPALLLFLAFSWYYLTFPDVALPAKIAGLTILYSLITWTAMALFGKEVWSRRGEAFTVAFGLLARFAPLEQRDGKVHLRPFGQGLRERVSASQAAFIVCFLAVVSFAAFADTPAWVGLVVDYYGRFGRVTGAGTLGLLSYLLLWAALFLLACALGSLATGRMLPLPRLLEGFAPALVPALLAYHAGHYLALLLTRGQLLVPLVSDPFGLGWNLFGTAGHQVDLEWLGAGVAWYIALTAIVLGHAVAARLVYDSALRLSGVRGTALRASLPLLALLTASALLGLWMLAQPLLELSPPA